MPVVGPSPEPPSAQYDWAPTALDVALYVPQRVSDSTGTFTDTSVPSVSQVNELVALVAEDVYAAAGTIPANLLNAARHVTALGAAWLIEQAYTSNTAEEKSPRLDALAKMYTDALARLVKAAQEGAGDVVPDAVYGFPDLTSTDEVPFGQFSGGMSWATNF